MRGGDWTVGEPISKELLATLNQARSVLFPEQEKTKETEKKEEGQTTQADRPEQGDGAGRKDT